jgi:signal transduction histidine kinase
MTPLWRIGIFFRERQRWVLIALLVVLHLTLLAGSSTAVGLMCWLVDVGLFILWQPFIQTERKLDPGTLLLVVLVLAGGAWLFGWWLLILWVTVLAALLGGRVLLLGHRPTRIFYLLAFAYLLFALLVWLVPRVVPDAALIGPSLDRPFAWSAPLIFVAMLLMPNPREIRLPSVGMVDFFYSLFIFLLISVLVLGSLAFMLLRQSLYIEAVFKTLVSMAAMLLLIAWAWNPRPGFSGIGVFLSRYLLTIGLPFETWLQRLMECAESEGDPDLFLSRAFERMLELPWVAGGAWVHASGAEAGSGSFGQESRFREDFPNQPLILTLYSRHKLSPALMWHFNLLAQLTNEYYIAKQRARELQQMSYLSAVHETGARLTHDVKNLLQSLSNLCFMAQEHGDTDGARLHQLLQRQLPQITQRLHQTLEKLQAPQMPPGRMSGGGGAFADIWWESLQQRYAHDNIFFSPVALDKTARLPAALFDSVADNLLQNALLKRQGESSLVVRVTLAADASLLRVCDNGSVVREEIVNDLMRALVPSENGLGIGLYHAAKQAEGYGYELRLASNVAGQVCFELKAN